MKNILNNFKEILGQYCAINQFVELGKRCFVTEHQKALETREEFVELAIKNSITLTCYDADKMVNAISRSYIVNVHLCFETFLKEAYNQVKKYGKGGYQEKQKEDSWLTCVTKNVLKGNLPDDLKPIFELCEYYRLIRNTAVHDLCDIDSHVNEYKKLQKYNFKTEAKFAKLSAPNEYEKISFDDFVMFSRSCVEVATYLFNQIVYDYEKIIEDVPEFQKKVWRKYSDQRCARAIISYLNTEFKLDDSLDGQMSRLIEYVKAR